MEARDLIYIDWNLFSILRKPEQKTHIVLDRFLQANSDRIKLVYSDAHLGDLAKTAKDKNDILVNDLNLLSVKTKDLTIVKYFGRDGVDVGYRNTSEFYNTIEEDNSSAIIKPFIESIKQINAQYGSIRDEIIVKHFKTNPKNICNFSITQLDELVKMMGICSSLKELVELGLQLRGDTFRNPLSYTDYYMTAYQNLDLIGYFPDSMSGEDPCSNLLNDSKHSAYGSMCKAFITNDNKCYHKSKLLFDYYGSKSKLIRTCKVKDVSRLEEELNTLL